MGNCYLGIELGSTRIKAVAADAESLAPICTGCFSWKSSTIDGIFSYSLDEAWRGLREALGEISVLPEVSYAGISGMMHGYLAFDENWRLLTPFRTWQNTITARAARELTALFHFNIPQRWSVAHLYEAILNGEEHVSRVAHITTLAGYVHYMLTGINAVGIGEASGIFPIDSEELCYDKTMLRALNGRLAELGFHKRAEELFPRVLRAGENGGYLTEEGSKRLGGLLPAGLPLAPPEGDAGTGMVATNSISPTTGNISAGTSIFAMVVLESPISNVHEEIDMVTTPDGRPVAMVHCNNCTAELDAWISLLGEALELFGTSVDRGELFTRLYQRSLEGETDCGGVIVCNYLSAEVLTQVERGLPMLLRVPGARLDLANFIRSHIYSSFATLRIGIDLLRQERVKLTRLTGHGGLFKTPGVAQRYMAAALDTDILCLDTSGEGGPYGMALLAAYAHEAEGYDCLADFLSTRAFRGVCGSTVTPEPDEVKAFSRYMSSYLGLLSLERLAADKVAERPPSTAATVL